MTDPPSDLRIREAARAVVLSPEREVLLVRLEFPAGTRWALPGGGLDPGETHEAALVRELAEELGLTGVEIGCAIWHRLQLVRFLQGDFDGQREQIYLVRVPARFEPQPALSWDALRAEYVFELRWWSIDEILAEPESELVQFVPRSLGRHLRDLVDGGPPNAPIDVGV